MCFTEFCAIPNSKNRPKLSNCNICGGLKKWFFNRSRALYCSGNKLFLSCFIKTLFSWIFCFKQSPFVKISFFFKEKFLKNLMKEKDQGVELVISYRDVLIKRRTVYWGTIHEWRPNFWYFPISKLTNRLTQPYHWHSRNLSSQTFTKLLIFVHHSRI